MILEETLDDFAPNMPRLSPLAVPVPRSHAMNDDFSPVVDTSPSSFTENIDLDELNSLLDTMKPDEVNEFCLSLPSEHLDMQSV